VRSVMTPTLTGSVFDVMATPHASIAPWKRSVYGLIR
jgi:hypothetical protein